MTSDPPGFYTSTDDLGEFGKEVGKGWYEFIAMNEPTVIAKSLFDAVIVKDSEGNGCLPNPPCTNEGKGFELFSERDDLLDQ